MAIDLKFSKADRTTPWGFRLVGGADFSEPLVVVKVNENSFAENAGLMVGDVIVRINDTPTAGINHADAHELIHRAGCQFVAAVRRGLFSDIPVPTEEENNNEVENTLQYSIAERSTDIQKDQTIGLSPNLLENLAGQDQLVSTVDVTSVKERVRKPKQFSKFLVKPRNSIPISKQVEEERKIIGEPYRVKIIKQPRRDPKDVLNHKKTVHFGSNVTEVEISPEASLTDSTESLEISEVKGEYEVDMETSVQVTEEITVETYDGDEEDDQDKHADSMERDSLENEIEQNDDESNIRNPKSILKPPPFDIHIDPVICESSLPLEQQLAAVQRQLLALSQLPTAIQVTLEAVTQQLNKIVSDKLNYTDENEDHENGESENDNVNLNEKEENIEEEPIDENGSESENAEGDITENEAEDNHDLEELEEDSKDKEDTTTEGQKENESEEHQDNHVELDPYAGLTEEEKDAKIREEKLMAKKLKIEEKRRQMDWTQRPIVLPGGRKWSDPDDATPKPIAPKMSDEKISKTIEDFSEVLVGKTKGSTTGTKSGRGEIKKSPSTVPESQTALWYPAKLRTRYINFLKYQPPPKNLDYLQKSEVYRLIHGMEGPEKGVGARAEKILSEKDYYGDKGAP